MTKKKIIIVDDDAIIREVVSRVMRSEGYEVVACENGPKAVHEAFRFKPDMLILDLMMASPDPRVCPIFDGYSVLDWLKTVPELEGIPVIVLSALPAAERKEGILRAGAVAYIQKPFDRADLVQKVKGVLGAGWDASREMARVHSLQDMEKLLPGPSVYDTNWRIGRTEVMTRRLWDVR